MNNNNDLIILCIFSIVILILLFKKNKTKKETRVHKVPIKKKVRINPIPVAEYVMNPAEKFYEMKDIKEDTKKDILVLLCYANWCDQCAEYKKIFEELKQQQPFNSVYFDMVEEDERGKYVKYVKKVFGYPTVIIDNQGKQTQYTGARDKMSLLKHIKNIINY